MNVLETATTAELIAELKARSRVFALYLEPLSTEAAGHDRSAAYKGPLADIHLLLDWGKWTLQQETYLGRYSAQYDDETNGGDETLEEA